MNRGKNKRLVFLAGLTLFLIITAIVVSLLWVRPKLTAVKSSTTTLSTASLQSNFCQRQGKVWDEKAHGCRALEDINVQVDVDLSSLGLTAQDCLGMIHLVVDGHEQVKVAPTQKPVTSFFFRVAPGEEHVFTATGEHQYKSTQPGGVAGNGIFYAQVKFAPVEDQALTLYLTQPLVGDGEELKVICNH